MCFRKKVSDERTYLQIIVSRRGDDQVGQR
jgi:hypothetical protein